MKISISIILFFSCVLAVLCSNRVVYKSVQYPTSQDESNVVVKGNLLYSVLVYEDGTIFSVGNNTHFVVHGQQYLHPRVIRKFKVSKSSVDKFIEVVKNSGFLDLPVVKDSKSNLICDTFRDIKNNMNNHEVCHPPHSQHHIISEIKSGLKTLITSHTQIVIYTPSEVFVKSVQVPAINGVHAYTNVDLHSHKDFEKGKLILSSHPIFKTVWEGVNKGYTYFDGFVRIQFIASIKGLSVFESTTDEKPIKVNTINDNFVVGVVFFLVVSFLMLFFSIVVVFLIKKKLLKKHSSENEDSITMSDKEKSYSIEEENHNFSQNSFPVIIQTSNMSNYPVFVPANTQNNTLFYPQPQVYYPVNTQQF